MFFKNKEEKKGKHVANKEECCGGKGHHSENNEHLHGEKHQDGHCCGGKGHNPKHQEHCCHEQSNHNH